MAVITAKFMPSFRGLIASMSLETASGYGETITEPGEIVIDATETVYLTTIMLPNDYTYDVDKIYMSVTDTEGASSEYTIQNYGNATFTIDYYSNDASILVIPSVALIEYTATLSLGSYFEVADYPTEVVATGTKKTLEVTLPTDLPVVDPYIFVGWSQLLPASENIGSQSLTLTYRAGDSVEIPSYPPWSVSDQYVVWAMYIPRNGIEAVYVGYNGEMQRAIPYVGLDGKWVPCNIAVGVQGYFEVTKSTSVLGVGVLGNMILGA